MSAWRWISLCLAREELLYVYVFWKLGSHNKNNIYPVGPNQAFSLRLLLLLSLLFLEQASLGADLPRVHHSHAHQL